MLKKLLIVGITSLSLFGAGNPSLVETTTLIQGEVNPLQEFVGTVKFEKSSTLAAQNSGIVKAINFEIGDKVKKDKTLVQIDADILMAQINAAKATLESAQQTSLNSSKDYERYKALLESKSITQKEYDDALLKRNASNSNVQALEANLKQLQIQAYKKNIKAPYDGIVVEKNVQLGEWVNAGSNVAKIVDTSKIEVTFNVPSTIVNGLKQGQMYDIFIDGKTIPAKLNAIIPNGDKLTRTFPVQFKANVKDMFIYEGQEAKVSLSKNGKINALILPRDAVIKRFGQNVVFMIDDKMMAQMIPVQIIGFVEKNVAVASENLKAGMQIVSKGNERVFPNTPVQIINQK